MELRKLNSTTISDPFSAPLRVIQFGEGNFLRAFADWIIDIMNEKKLFNGKIAMVQPIAQGLSDLINNQDGLYHVFCRGYHQGEYVEDTRLIKSVETCINPYASFNAYLELGEIESLDIVISNTTEAGIRFDESDNLEDAPAGSFPAKLTQLMYRRYKHFKGAIDKGYTILPCELIEKNADALKIAVLKYAELWDLGADFIYWVNAANSFHNTLVDRIVPGFPKANTEEYKRLAGYDDQLMVAAEYFHLWIIEASPELEAKIPFGASGLNVKLVEDLTPYRERKVKVLNASHTAMCPVSLLYGKQTVRETVEDDFTNMFIEDMLYGEILPTVNMDDAEKRQFAADVLERFKNPSINHLLSSIALNSVSKFKVRNLPSLLDYIDQYKNVPQNLTFSLAALIVFYKGVYNQKPTAVNDDASVVSFFKNAWRNDGYHAVARAVLSNEDLWDLDLTAVEGLHDAVATFVEAIDKYGIEEGYNLLFSMEDYMELA